MTASYTVDHSLDERDGTHTLWDSRREPIRTVESGDVVRFDCPDANGGLIDRDSTTEQLSATPDGHYLVGPIGVSGARAGDVLEVELLAVEHGDWGYSYVRPGDRGVGLLPEEFPDPWLYGWELDDDVGYFEHGIEVPLAPFPGVVGVAPPGGESSTLPPRRWGGNLDVKQLTAGSTLYLPVGVEGALFSIGDGHAAQGDGEVCVTAIETAVTVTARLSIRRDLDIDAPQFRTSGSTGAESAAGPTAATASPTYATTGVADDLMDASKAAVRAMIDHLSGERDLTRREAYVLCSVAADLRISEVVNEPNVVVSAHLPERIFP